MLLSEYLFLLRSSQARTGMVIPRSKQALPPIIGSWCWQTSSLFPVNYYSVFMLGLGHRWALTLSTSVPVSELSGPCVPVPERGLPQAASPAPSPSYRHLMKTHSDNKESACNAGDLGSTPGLGSFPGERNGNSFQYSGLDNSTDRGA